MNRKSVVHRAAQVEIDQQAAYLAEHADDATAYRFLDAVDETIISLLQTPGIGAPWISDHPRLQGIRRHAVIGFKNHMLLYRVLDEVFEVLHLYHSAQDIETRLNENEGV